MRNTGLPAPFPGLAAPPPHFDLLRLDRSLDTFPRQTPGCAESKSHFHLELCLSCALRRSRSPLLPKGSCEQTPPKNRIHWNQALGQAAASNGPTGRGGRHLLGTGETCVRCPLPWSFSRRLCSDLAARGQGPQQPPRITPQVPQNSHFPCFSKT